MVCISTVLRGIVVIWLAGSSCSDCALTLEQQFQQLRNDYVRTKELLENNIIRLETEQARLLEVLELKVQPHNLLEDVLKRRVDQLEESSAKLQEKMIELEKRVQQQETNASVQHTNRSSATSTSVPNGITEFIRKSKVPAEPSDAAKMIPKRKGVIRMDYNSLTLNKVPSSCIDVNDSQQCEIEE